MRKLLQVFFWALIVCAVVEITNEGRDVAAFGLGKISLDVDKFGTKFGDVGDGLVAEGVCIVNFSRNMEMARVGLGFGKDLRRIGTRTDSRCLLWTEKSLDPPSAGTLHRIIANEGV